MNTKHGIFLAIFGILVFCAFIGTVSAATIYVPDEYEKIQWAVDNATTGDTIIVRDGTYSENVNVNKRLTIRSENGSANCIVDAAEPDDHVFAIAADYVNISGFTVTGSTGLGFGAGMYIRANHCNITNNKASNNEWCGILLSGSDNSTLTNNNASNNYVGILLGYSSNNTLTNNIMSANKYNFGVFDKYIHNIDISNKVDGKPIYYLIDEKNKQIPSNAGYVGIVNCTNITVNNLTLTDNYQGVLLAYSSNSRIENMTVSNTSEGFRLYYSSNNTLTNNSASNNGFGIYLEYSNNNTLASNDVSNNEGNGIRLEYSNNNTFINNSASNNNRGLYLKDSNNNTLTNNDVSNNIRSGIYLDDSDSNTLTNNEASNDDECGIYVDRSDNNILTDNDMSNNSHGIYVYSSDNNTLTNNNASYNNVGICLGGYSSDNEIAKNNAYPNERVGIEIAASQSERNKIYMNNFKGSTSGPSGPPQIEFTSAHLTSLVVHFHYDMGILVGATAYAGFENTGGSGTVEIVARIPDTIAMKSSTFDIKSDGVYDLEIEITMCEVGVGVEEDYNLALSSPSAGSSYEIGLGCYRSLSASISAINLIPVVVSKNLWNSTEKINYTYKGKNYTNYLGNYWTDYEGIDANGDGIGDTPYSIDSDKDNYPLMEPWENYFKPPEEKIFDTEAPANPYPSIMGTHNGTIKPNQTITVSTLYTYPCAGTGGHSEYVAFYNATTGEVIVNGTWNGYQGAGDYHYIEFSGPFTLEANVTYNYTIKTGSYPQIHHNRTLIVPDGEITCTEFIDANGKRYDNWIPAIKLE